MGNEAYDILSSFTMSDDNREKHDAVKAKFEGHFSIERNVIFERAKLNLRVQKEGESADKFITDLYTLILLQIYRPLLSRQVSQSLKLINKIDAINKKDYRTDIVEHCPKLFKGLGEIEGEYEMKLNENSKPFALTVPRKVPLPRLSKTKQEIDRMLKIGVIRIVNEPTDWCAPMVVLPKQNGQMRICVDFTKLIANIKREVHQLPSVEFTLGKLENSKIFSKLDTNSAFWQ